jgi:hypothetical protein
MPDPGVPARFAAEALEEDTVRRGWVAVIGLLVAVAAIYGVLSGVSMGDHDESRHEIDERSRQDLRELLRGAEEAG